MTQQKFNPRIIFLLALMTAVAILRVVLNPKSGFAFLSNFTPVGAMALFGGAYFTSKKAYIFPLLTLWLSDILLSRFVYHHEWQLFYSGFYWIYGAFTLMVVAGNYLLRNISVKNIMAKLLKMQMT